MAGLESRYVTEPLVPPDIDLRDFPFMPLDIGRLFGSEFHAQSEDGAWRAGVTLWLKSYHQVPAASVPDDDIALARLAELGRDVKAWRKMKAAALRGWVKCDDGRLYHPVVAEKALEGWLEKLGQRKSSAAGNAKRYNMEFDPSSFDTAIEDIVGRLAKLNPSSRLLAKRLPKPSRKTPDGSPADLPLGSQETLKGQRTEETKDNLPPPSTSFEGEGEIRIEFERFLEAFSPSPSESRTKAFEVFNGLEHHLRAQVFLGLPGFLEHRRNHPTTRPMSVFTFLSERRFEGFVPKQNGSAVKNVLIKITDPRWDRCVARYRAEHGKTPPSPNGSWHFPAAWAEELSEATA